MTVKQRMVAYRGIVPGTFTMGNLICGFFAIVSAAAGSFETASWLILLAVFLDALDGRIARLSGSSSEIGKQLDGLADIISFGVAPALMVYYVTPRALSDFAWLVPIVFLMAAAFRLARYNLLADSDEKQDFLGLPVPFAASVISTYILFSHRLWGEMRYGDWLTGGVVLCSFLMVSEVIFDTYPEGFRYRKDRVKLVVLILAGLLVVVDPRLMLFPVVVAYVFFAMIREAYRLLYGLTAVEVDETDDQTRREE